jgi:hypothetical protein
VSQLKKVSKAREIPIIYFVIVIMICYFRETSFAY